MIDVVLEDLMGQLGEFGTYQIIQHSLHVLTSFLAGMHMLSMTFTAPTPPHRCKISEVDEDYKLEYKPGKGYKQFFNASGLNGYIKFSKADGDELALPDSCKKIKGSSEVSCGGDYVYNFDTYHPTVRVVQNNLVCEDRWKRAVLQTSYLFGVLLGVIVLGPFADIFGRKPILYLSAVLQVVFGVGLAFVTNYWGQLVTLIVFGAFASGGAYVTGFVLSMELVGASKRTLCGTNFSIMFTMGTILLVATAYFVRNAQHLQIILGCYSLVMIGHWWLVDESIRWLWSKGRREEAIAIAAKAVKRNGKVFVDRYSKDSTNEPTSIVTNEDMATPNSENELTGGTPKDEEKMEMKTSIPQPEEQKSEKKYGLADLFRFPVMRTRVLLVAFNWFANSIVYYGISFNTETLFGNPFLNFFFSALAEIPGFVIVNFGVPYTGRRTLMAVCLGLGGVMCFVAASFSGKNFTVTAFSLLSKVGIAVSFTIVYNYTAELFPTVVRNSAVGFCAMAARVAGMISPMLTLLDSVHQRIPVITFGFFAIFGAIFCCFLPETSDTILPETLEDGENFQLGDTAFTICCPGKRGKIQDENQNKGDASNGEVVENSNVSTTFSQDANGIDGIDSGASQVTQ